MGSYYDQTKYNISNPKLPEVTLPFGDLELFVPKKSWDKIINYAKAAKDLEISGFADCKYDKELGQIIVGEVYLLEQSVGGATVHMDEEAVSKFNMELVKKGVKQLPQIWWHSHVDMGAFFSGTDQETSEQLRNDSYSVSLVVNKRGDSHARMYINTKIQVQSMGENFVHEDWVDISDLTVRTEHEDKIPQAIIDEVEKKIHQKKYKLPKFDKTQSYGKHWFGKGKKKDDEDDDDGEPVYSLEDHTTTRTYPVTDFDENDDYPITIGSETGRSLINGTREGTKDPNENSSKNNSQKEDAEDLRDNYTTDSDVALFLLPANKTEAMKIIFQIGLGRQWNNLAQEWVYVPRKVDGIRYEDMPQVMYIDWYEKVDWDDTHFWTDSLKDDDIPNLLGESQR